MGVPQIENSVPAFSSAGQDLSQALSRDIITLPCSTAVTANTLVAVSAGTSGATAFPNAAVVPYYATVAPGTAATTSQTLGVALDTTTATAQLVRVVTQGVALITGTIVGTLATGTVFSCGTSAVPTVASTVIGANVGIVLQNSTTAQSLVAFITHM